jgi:outer membrane receptor protein involved in Fe transport
MKKKFAIPVLLFVLCITAAHAQTKKQPVSGTVKDSLEQKALSFATVSIYKPNQLAEAFKTTYTNDKGKFTFTGVDSGRYTIVFSHAGYKEREQAIAVDYDKPLAMDDITLSVAAATESSVTVTARKPLIEQTDDKIIFNVANDPASKTENAIDILRKTPFVSVDGEDNIMVNGQNNFKVLLNGKETAMFSQNVKEALKGFPGALITKIEVITSPSAKYDGEGVGGIINIITKKKVVGYNGSVSSYYSSTGWSNFNTNFSAKFGKFGATVYYGAGGSSNIKAKAVTETVPVGDAFFSRRVLAGDRVNSNFWNWGNAELSYELDSLNTFSAYGNISGGWNRGTLSQLLTTEFDDAPISESKFALKSRNEYPTKGFGTDYIRKFNSNKDKEFSIRFNGEFGNSNTFLNSEQDNPVGFNDRFIINNSVAENKQYTLQSDFIQPLKNNQKIETGIKMILRNATSDFKSQIKYNPSEDYKINLSNTDYFKYRQDVYSVYGTYNFKIKKTAFRIGARVEHTTVDGDFTSSNTVVKQDYTTLLPNVQATIKTGPKYTWVINYNMRLQRPYIWNLNPFVTNNDSLNISYGNPNLDAQTIHSLSLQTRIMKGSSFAGLTLTGTYSDNLIVYYSIFDKATGVTRSTSANLGKEYQLSLNTNLSVKINKDWNVFFNGSVRYNNIENKTNGGQKNNGIGGNGNMNTSYQINKKLLVTSYGGFWRSPVTIQYKYPLNHWYGLGMGYKFFNEKLTATVSAANFLRKNMQYKMTLRDPAFQTTTVNTMPFRGLAVSLSYNFGKLTENVSKKKGVSNDDLLGSGSSSN